MESTAQHERGKYGMSKCICFVKTLLGRNCAQIFQIDYFSEYHIVVQYEV